jgi:hypothetical protein
MRRHIGRDVHTLSCTKVGRRNMILVVLASCIAWMRSGGPLAERAVRTLIVTILVAGMTTIIAGSVPVAEIPLGTNETLRVMPGSAFPFTIQQYRDYDADLFSYRIVIGWPDGVTIYETALAEDQSHLIHWANFWAMAALGSWMLVGSVATIAFLSALQYKRGGIREVKPAKTARSDLILLIPLSAFSVSFVLYRLAGAPPFLPGQLFFDIGFAGLFMSLLLFMILLLIPASSQLKREVNQKERE